MKNDVEKITKDIGGEFPEANVAAAGLLAVVEDQWHEIIRVEGYNPHRRQAEESQPPSQPPENVRQRQYRGPHDRRRQMKSRMPPLPWHADYELTRERGREREEYWVLSTFRLQDKGSSGVGLTGDLVELGVLRRLSHGLIESVEIHWSAEMKWEKWWGVKEEEWAIVGWFRCVREMERCACQLLTTTYHRLLQEFIEINLLRSSHFYEVWLSETIVN